MKKLLLAAALALVASPALAQSAKYSLQVARTTRLAKANALSTTAGKVEGAWTPILSTRIKTSSQKDLVFNVALEAALLTDTTVRSSAYKTDTSTAESAVEVKVLIDGNEVEPGDVTFARRLQTLQAKFDGFSCTDTNRDNLVTYDECSFTDEELRLLQETMSAHAFFFAADDVGTGTHDVQVLARLVVDAASVAGAAKAEAWVGKGAVTVEEVRLVKGMDITTGVAF